MLARGSLEGFCMHTHYVCVGAISLHRESTDSLICLCYVYMVNIVNAMKLCSLTYKGMLPKLYS